MSALSRLLSKHTARRPTIVEHFAPPPPEPQVPPPPAVPPAASHHAEQQLALERYQREHMVGVRSFRPERNLAALHAKIRADNAARIVTRDAQRRADAVRQALAELEGLKK